MFIMFWFLFCFVCLFSGECDEPTFFPNATFTIDNTKYVEGTYALYTCNPGHRMGGEADYIVHVCRESANGSLEWEGPSVKCDGKFRIYSCSCCIARITRAKGNVLFSLTKHF